MITSSCKLQIEIQLTQAQANLKCLYAQTMPTNYLLFFSAKSYFNFSPEVIKDGFCLKH